MYPYSIVRGWLEELQEREDFQGLPLEQWATAEISKNYDEAERLFRKALELEPKNEFACKNYETMKRQHNTC